VIRIDHKLKSKGDEVDGLSLTTFIALQEDLRLSKQDAEEKLLELFGEKSSWFDVIIDQSIFNIRISPTSETRADDDKMRLYKYFIDHHGQEIGQYVRNRIHINTRIAFRAEARGVGYVY